MPVLIAIVGLLVGALIWYNRMKQAGHVAGELKDAANDVRLAARWFGFKRRSNVHPIDALDDARLVAAGIVVFARWIADQDSNPHEAVRR